MTTFEPRAPDQQFFDELLVPGGHSASDGIAEFLSLASTVQRVRFDTGASDRTAITRTTAAWALTQVDGEVSRALAAAGVSSPRLLQQLGLRAAPPAMPSTIATLDARFAEAMAAYLAALPRGSVITPRDVMLAILDSVRTSEGGRLPERLREAEFNPVLARDLLHGGSLDDIESEFGSEASKFASEVEFEPPRPPGFNDRTIAPSDLPATPERDLLGRSALAESILNRIKDRQPAEGSYLVHLDGPWGSGKSTLFGLLRSKIDTGGMLSVSVNAWREEQSGAQWWALYSALRKSLGPRGRALGWWDIVVIRKGRVLATAIALVVAIALFVWVAGLDFDLGGRVADALVKGATLIGLAVAGVTAAYRFFRPGAQDSTARRVAATADPTGEIVGLFSKTLRRAGKPVVFLIDDLDRCDATYIVGFLHAIQTLVRDALNGKASGPFVIIAADGVWIRAAYESHYDSLHLPDLPGRPLGYGFLDKIFQLHVRLPSISDRLKQRYYESLLHLDADSTISTADQRRLAAARAATALGTEGSYGEATQVADAITNLSLRAAALGEIAVKESSPAELERTEHDLIPFGRFLEPNPRSVKLFVGDYGMLRTLRTLEGVRTPVATLALWTVLETRWPMLADHLRDHPDDIDLDAGAHPPTEIERLLRSNEVRSVIAGVDLPALTPADVRECTGGAT